MIPRSRFQCGSIVLLCVALSASSDLLSLRAAGALPTAMDSLMTAWSDELRPMDERFSAFDQMYQKFYQQYPDSMLSELEKLRIKAEEFNRPHILFEAFNRKGNLLNYQGKMPRHCALTIRLKGWLYRWGTRCGWARLLQIEAMHMPVSAIT